MKITEALCNWIQSKGETPTDEDIASVTHALQSLYYAKGGQGGIPPQFANSVADMINGIAYVDGGGGGSEPTTCTMTVTFSQAYGTPSIGMTKKWDDEWKQYQAMSFSSGTQTYTDVAHAGLVYVYVNKADATITVSPGDGCYVMGNGTWTAAGGQYPCVLVKLAENASAVTFTVTTAHA